MALSDNLTKAIGYGAGVAGVGNALFGNNSFDEYANYMNQGIGTIDDYYNKASGFMSPYRDAGGRGLNGYENMLAKYQDPTKYYNDVASSYQMSPGAQFRMNTGMDAVRNAMAAQGLGGSGQEGRELTNYTQGVINQDMNSYIDRVFGVGQTGLQGYGNLSGLGFNAANASGNYAMGAAGDIAGMQSAMGQAASAQANNDNRNLWGGLGSAAASFFL
jgi:hypothetical protein